MHYALVALHVQIQTAAAYECLGKCTEARNCLNSALQIALPDQFLSSILMENYEYLEELLQREIQTADAAEHVFLTKVTELGKNCQKRYGALRKTHMFPKIAAELTEQEQRIIELLAERLSNREIAEKLFLSEGNHKTVHQPDLRQTADQWRCPDKTQTADRIADSRVTNQE